MLGDDLLGQAMRCVRGIDVTEDSVSIEAMRQVCLEGPGHYLGHPQTLELMQTEYIYPAVANRMSPKEWVEAGKPELLDRAIARKNAILAKAGNRIDAGDRSRRSGRRSASIFRADTRRGRNVAESQFRAAFTRYMGTLVMHYGYIGLGNLGGHLAASLLRGGFEVTVHDRDPALAERHLALGGHWAASAGRAGGRLGCGLHLPALAGGVRGGAARRCCRGCARGRPGSRCPR